MQREFTKLKWHECDFFFYAKSGSWAMYGENIRNYWFCIPFIIGIKYTVSWGG